MKKLLYITLALVSLTLGCVSKQRCIEGTSLALGAYLPWENSLYGVELLQYVNGASLSMPTNTLVEYEREYAATNSYFWGMVETKEWSKSKVKTTSPEDYSPTIY